MTAIRKKSNNRIVIVAICIIFVAAFILLFVPFVHADIFQPNTSEVQNVFQYMIDSGITEMISISNHLGDTFDGVTTTIFDFFKIVGASLMTVYVIVDLLRDLTKGRYDLNMWLKFFINVAIGYGLIFFLSDILKYIEQFGTSFAFTISDDFSSSIADYLTTIEGQNALLGSDLTTIELIGVSCLIAYMKVMRYSLFLEIYVRKCFAPIAIDSIVMDGTRSAGYKYFKRLFAAYTRTAIMVMALCITAMFAVQPAIISEGLLAMIAIFFAGATLIRKSTSLADSLFGL